MSDESDPPPLRLKPRSRLENDAASKNASSSSDQPATQPVGKDASGGGLKLRPRPKLDDEADAATEPGHPPPPLESSKETTKKAAEEPAKPMRLKPRLPESSESTSAETPSAQESATVPPASPSSTSPEGDSSAEEAPPSAAADGPHPTAPRFKLKPKESAADASRPEGSAAPQLPPPPPPAPMPSPAPSAPTSGASLPGEDSSEVLRPKIPPLATPDTTEVDLNEVAANLPPPPGLGSKPRTSRRRRRKPSKFGVAATLFALVLLTVGGVGGVYWFFFAADEPPPPPPQAQTTAPASLPGQLVGKATDALDARAAAQDDLGGELSDRTAPASDRAVPLSGDLAVPPAATAAQVLPSAEFQKWVTEARISGVLQGAQPRALINGRTVRQGDVVDATLGIYFEDVNVEEKYVVFRDQEGALVGKKY